MAGLATFLQAGGFLSLMFYNREAALLKRVLHGEFAVARRDLGSGPERRGWGDGAMPLAEEPVRGWLAGPGLNVRSKAGIRIFHNQVRDAELLAEHLDKLIAVELAVRRTEPFASLSQHTHLIAARA